MKAIPICPPPGSRTFITTVRRYQLCIAYSTLKWLCHAQLFCIYLRVCMYIFMNVCVFVYVSMDSCLQVWNTMYVHNYFVTDYIIFFLPEVGKFRQVIKKLSGNRKIGMWNRYVSSNSGIITKVPRKATTLKRWMMMMIFIIIIQALYFHTLTA